MLSNWFSQPQGSGHSSADETRVGDNDADTQVMEPDQGNACLATESWLLANRAQPSPVTHHLTIATRRRSESSRPAYFHPRASEHAGKNNQVRVSVPEAAVVFSRLLLTNLRSFMCHPELLLQIPETDDPVERFVSVVKFYLSGWHIRPPGAKKPLNPILGEIFTCYWELGNNKRAYYISEQTSHHPPKSSYFYMAPDYHIRIDGTLKPRSRFLGNSAASLMEGVAYLSFLNRRENKEIGEQYILTQPNMYARGILFGKMKYELGDHSFVRCPELGLTADIEFKTKGWVSGTYNAIGGVIKRESTGEVLYELSGLWSHEMFIKNVQTGHKDMFFNALTSRPSSPKVRPLAEQEDRESQKLWALTAKAVKERNHEEATDEKTKIEDRQREEAAARAQDGVDWHPRLFRRVKPGDGVGDDLEWIIHTHVDPTASPAEQTKQLLSIYPVIDGQKLNGDLAIPPHKEANGHAEKKGAAGDLIDIDGDALPAAQSTTIINESSEIEKLLNATGKPAGGALIDFADGMKKDLPAIGDKP
ncbi:Oxysterol-binding protein [Metarhizium album ARSEF 1941]|uniref:Oxysterol-binding protein n=1 Tax=Metarhizium album (strain ARSEF 1941) TaxID=1081103 RepID=A0A0B2WQI0_METAS|nr:Oxysterol-binding protein [Metarhizium album ARSEF 1941]KHN96263.1 Oxysterol-binding protein [Metarhizium album ARSEF 1941]